VPLTVMVRGFYLSIFREICLDNTYDKWYNNIYKGGLKLKDKVTFSPEQLVSSTQLVRKLSQYLEASLDYPLFIQRDQKVSWVLLSLEEYERLIRARRGK